MKKLLITIAAILVLILLILSYFLFLKKNSSAEPGRVVVSLFGAAPELEWPIRLALFLRGKSVSSMEPGGYRISDAQSAWQNTSALLGDPYMKWVVIPEGLRKEEIAELLATALGWTDEMKNKWITVDTAPDSDHTEGVYFPDTYLIPLTETTAEVATRFRRRFDEKFVPLTKEAAAENIKWTTLVNLASIIQREAAGKNDMPLISGVLWNRLEKGMRLEVDATVQYARGNRGDGYWAKINLEDKKIDSPYNTFLNKGLPPRPIANPGLEAMEAALRPASTTCLFYLHTPSREIHCADTYETHKQNIETYL